MPSLSTTLTFRATPVLRESDARMMLLIEVSNSSGNLVNVSVVDRQDYEED